MKIDNFNERKENFRSREVRILDFNFSLPEDSYYDVYIHYNPQEYHLKCHCFLNNLALGEINLFPNEKNALMGELKLKRGNYTLSIGHIPEDFQIHHIELVKKEKSNFKFPEFKIRNNLTDSAKKLLEFFEKIYSKYIIAGQHTNTSAGPEIAYIEYITGKLPALRGFDFLSYSSKIRTENMTQDAIIEIEGNKGSTEKAIEWGKDYKGIVTFCWHWYAPSGGRDKTFYTINTNFDLEEALKSGTEENKVLMLDIDLIAKELLKLKSADIPVLWRPLHEADGRWFWWGAKGPKAYKELYYLLFDILTNKYGLNNLIWIWNAPHPDWKIDDEYYDIAGIDNYVPAGNYGPMKFSFDYLSHLTNYKKPLALTENGPIPDPDLLFEYESYFLWFMPWFGTFVFDHNINSKEHLIKVYNHEHVITLDKFQCYNN